MAKKNNTDTILDRLSEKDRTAVFEVANNHWSVLSHCARDKDVFSTPLKLLQYELSQERNEESIIAADPAQLKHARQKYVAPTAEYHAPDLVQIYNCSDIFKESHQFQKSIVATPGEKKR